MNIKKLYKDDPVEFMRLIERRVISSNVWKNDDYRQVFWLGVYKAIPNVDWSRDVLRYLVVRGYGEVKNYRMANYRHSLVKVCKKCGIELSLRARSCRVCGGAVRVDNRFYALLEINSVTMEDRIVFNVMVEQFIGSLTGKEQYVAKRWLLDRADLYYANHTKVIATELSLSAPAVSKIKKQIRQRFQVWMEG